MINSEILSKLQSASVEERIQIIEIILQSLKNDIGVSKKQSSSDLHSLKGKVTYYNDPYQPVASEDWEALT
ncbi:MAG: hypothetical protein KME06_16695 [Kastovskya adunca ATA6-11-RM4]|jgi:hypothetical protein|nr:hypothetical protein [Kastovskya adunca ATA6-11-RM4]